MPDTVTGWGLILSLRQAFDQYVNLRPARLLPGVHGPLARRRRPEDVDMVFVRENTEGEYAGAGGRVHARPAGRGRRRDVRVHPRRDRADRPLRVRARAAHGRRHGDERDEVQRAARTRCRCGTRCSHEVAADYPDIEHGQLPHRRARGRAMVARSRARSTWSWPATCSATSSPTSARRSPAAWASRPSANLDPDAPQPEPVPGRSTARRPTSPGAGIANPMAEIWSAAMLLDFLGETDAGAAS